MKNLQVSSYYQDVNLLISELKEAKKKLSKLGAALEVASRKLGLSQEDLLKVEALPQAPSAPELTEEQKEALYWEDHLRERAALNA